MSKDIKAFCQPDSKGFFGAYGGQYVPDAIKARLDELDQAFKEALADPEFTQEMQRLLLHFAGRPSPVFHCRNLSKKLGGAQIWLKREDLNHLGAHKVNNTIGQCLLAKRMGKTRVIAETGAGQHGVGTAASAALMGLECVICMGEVDVVRQHLNVTRMEMLGARVHTAMSGQRTLKEAVDEALEMWVNEPETFYVLGSAVGPHPYPLMVRHFQSVIGSEARAQMLEFAGRLPDVAMACVGGGSNAVGLFSGFVHDEGVRLIGVEPGGRGSGYGQHAASLCYGEPGVLHGFNSYMIKNDKGEAGEVYSISAGLDYPSVGPRTGRTQGCRSRRIREHHRRRGPAGLLCPVAQRRHPARAGILPRAGPCHETGSHHGQGRHHPGEPVRPRRQGRGPGGRSGEQRRLRAHRRLKM